MLSPAFKCSFSGFLCLLLFFQPLSGLKAQDSSVDITLDATVQEISLTPLVQWTIDRNGVWHSDGLAACRRLEGFRPLHKKAFVYRQFTGPAVLRFTIHTGALSTGDYVLHVRNTEIDRLQLLLIDDVGRTWESRTIGDIYPFHDRYLPYRTLAIPVRLEDHRTYTGYLGIDKPDRVISTTIDLATQVHYRQQNATLNLLYGLSLGLFLTFILVSFSLFALLKDRLYLYYGLYASSVFLTLFSVHGYSFQYLYPKNPLIQQSFLLIVQLLGLIFINLYAFRLIKFKHHTRVLGALKKTLICLYLFGLGYTLADLRLPESLERVLNYLFAVTQTFNFLFLLFFPLYYFIRFRKSEAIIFFISFLAIGIAVFYTNLSLLFSSLTYIPITYSVQAGLVIEMLILTVYMILKYKGTESKRLQAENLAAQEKLKGQAALIEGQESEKRRIAQNLHDNIGSSVALLKRQLETLDAENCSRQSDGMLSEIVRLSGQIRAISHELLPVTLEEVGLAAAVRELAGKYDTPVIHFHEQERLPPLSQPIAVQLYRILQELIKNTIVHAFASHVHIQLGAENGSFQMAYEDDGVGFDKYTFTKGLGFRSIETRLLMLNGSMNLEAAPGNGMVLMIAIPVVQDGR